MLRAGMTIYNIITDHPSYPKQVYEDDYDYAAFRDRETADRICAAWNGHYTNSGTPQPWPFYVVQCVVQPPNNGVQPTAGAGADDDVPLQMGLFR